MLVYFIPLKSIGQNLELVGNVEKYDIKESGRIFYTEDGNNFDVNKFVPYDKKRGYTFKISIAKIKKSNIKILAFTLNPALKTTDEDACVQRIYVAEILNSPIFRNLKTIKLRSDLLLDIFCEESMHSDAVQDGNSRFVGDYLFKINDTLRTIKTESMLYTYKALLSKGNPNYITEEIGTWEVNSEKKLLTFSIQYQQNEKFGLIISKRYKFEFEITEKPNGLSFSIKTGTLKKIGY